MSESGGGIGLLGAVFLVFLILKLVGVITWSWLWVFAPLWIPAALGVAVLLVVGVVALVGAAFAQRGRVRK